MNHLKACLDLKTLEFSQFFEWKVFLLFKLEHLSILIVLIITNRFQIIIEQIFLDVIQQTQSHFLINLPEIHFQQVKLFFIIFV